MKSKNLNPRFLVLASMLSSLLLTGCFGGGIDPKDDPVQPGGGSNAANSEEDIPENNAGLNEVANNAGGNNLGASNESNLGAENSGKDGEAINNAADENFLNANANTNSEANMFGNNPTGGLNNNNLAKNNGGLGNNNFGLSNGGDGALVNGAGGDILEAPAPDVDKGATDNSVQEPLPAGDSILAPVAENPTAPSPSGGGVVRYVSPGGSKLYDKPNGDTLRSLEQGDHPLVNEEGEWSRTSDGYYVPAASLTSSPIPRAKQAKDWR